ncbi:MAG: response regulator transcription factor, partial [Candidatus Dormibacterales bacterium]
MEDDVGAAEAMAAVLGRAGYRVEVALSGGAALGAVRARAPDAMLLDYELPDMDAPELLDELRAGGPRLPFPVIVLTGARLGAADQVLSLDRGAFDYVVKGTDRQVVLARLRVALRERRGGFAVDA